MRQGSNRSTLLLAAPEDTKMFFLGILLPTAIMAESKASLKSSPIQPTSPVELMSTPNTGSALCKRANENWEALIPIQSISNALLSGFVYGASSMIRVAVSIKLRFNTLDTNGKLREARKLHSITFTKLFFAKNWILNGPLIFNSFAIILLTFLIRRAVSK